MTSRTLPILWLALLVSAATLADEPETPIAVASPDGRIRIEVAIEPEGDAPHSVRYRVFLGDQPVLLSSPMGMTLADGTPMGTDSVVEGVERRPIRESYEQVPGKRRKVVAEGSEAVISLRERGEAGKRWGLVVRAYNDGVAFRYRVPEQEGLDRLEVASERTGFVPPNSSRATALRLNSTTTSHEGRYQTLPVADMPHDWLLGLPLLVEIPGTGWAALLEADVEDYAGLYLVPEEVKGAGLSARLSPRPGQPNLAVRADLPHESPWRVAMIAEKVERLVESDLVLNLNPPSAIGDASWIHPGKTTFPWWNGFFEKDVPFKMGLNTETAKHYIDFCEKAGIPYHSLDGVDNIAWYGGKIVPYEGQGITEGIDGLDLQEVLRYAQSKNVKIRLWMHWEAARKHMETAFPLYKGWGVEGVMIDFLDRDDQEMIDFVERLLKLTAENHLTVTVHGTKEPTGRERTYPHLLTNEAVMNLEYDKWDPLGIPPEHEVTIPFTRMLAGPLDFHQGSLRGVPISQFHPRNDAPLVMGTPSRMLASYVVYQNHMAMIADYPSSYRDHPALPTLVAIPVTWDETRCLQGKVGEIVVIARRSGDDWWLGAMNDRKPREPAVPLDFLGEGRYRADTFRDAPDTPERFAREAREVGKADTMNLSLDSAGGALVHFHPQPK